MDEPALTRSAQSGASLLAGGMMGGLAAVPPALQLGVFASRSAAPQLAVLQVLAPEPLQPFVLPIAHAVVFALTAAVVLCLGAAVGIALIVATLPLWRLVHARLPQRLRAGRPGWRTARIAVLLALLGGALVYADRRVGLPWPEAEPPTTSQWFEREKRLFRNVVSAHSYETLILPVQAEEPSFDRVARSLMTRYLTRRAEERLGATTADPTLLARALGARERSFALDDALGLAAKLGARRVVAAKVRRSAGTYSVQASLWVREGAGWKEEATGKLDKLPYGDRVPPSIAFRESVDSLLEQLGIGTAQTPQALSSAQPAELPVHDLRQLATLEGGSPAERASRLQVLAALHERESLEAETLWERSLVALWRAPGESEFERVLEARAYMHLYRRPYALERLGAPASAAGRALAAALNGNVPELEQAAAAIEDRGQRLVAEIELADLYYFYNLNKRLIERRKLLLELAWTEPTLLGYRLSAPEWFRGDVHAALAAELAKVAPLAFGWKRTTEMWLRWLYTLDDPLHEHNLALAHAVEQSYGPLWQAKSAAWAARRASDRLAEWDYYDLLFAANRRALLKTVYSTLYLQGLPAQAAATIERLGSLFAGYPRLMYFQAAALDRMGRDARPGAQKRLFSRSSALAVSAYRWEGGESHLSAAAEYYIYERPYQKYLDEPPRWYRIEVPRERLQFERLAFSAREMEREIAAARRRLDFSDRSERPLRDLVRWLRRAGRVGEALSIVDANRNRFVGSLTRAELLAQASEMAGVGSDPLPAYRELLDLDPDSWEARSRLARAYMEAGQPALAQKTYLAFPGFANQQGQNIVALSNYAFDAGYYLYRRGEIEHARPLFRQSTDLATWSAREIRSREILALLEDDLSRALRNAQYQVERYSDGQAGMRELLYLHLLGNREQAEALFFEYANRFGSEQVWTAALIAHRMRGLEGPALEAWLAQAAARDTRRDYLTGALRERHAFMLAYTDRPASDEALAHVRRVAQANNRSPFYPQLAEGYAAFRKGAFAAAAQKLRGPHNDLYNISINRRESLSEWLPHLVLAYARSGQPAEASKLLAEHLANIGTDADYLVARALMEGSVGQHASAAGSLRLAFHRLPRLGTRALPPGYTLLEACELLFTQTGNDVYRELIEDFARRLQVDLPYSWAAAFEAKYARDLDTRQLALAAASILDPKSERIAHFPETERLALRRAAARHASLLGAALRAAPR
jgi:hypothetical protein